MNSLMTNGFEGISSFYRNIDERNSGIMEAIRQISMNIQDGFKGVQIQQMLLQTFFSLD
jgi:hypothetical protein